MSEKARRDLRAIFEAAVASAHPDACLPPHLPPPPAGRVTVLATGKAAGSMAAATEAHYLDRLGLAPGRLIGRITTRHGYARPIRLLETVEAGHPVPDAAGVAAADAALALAAEARADDLILVLISGGGSALWSSPASGVSLAAKQALTRDLLRSGATIHDINTVRKHLSRIKGGRLAAAAHPAPLITLAISDVAGDDPATIASGPTVPDPTTLADARAALARFGVTPPPEIATALEDPANESPKPGDPRLAGTDYRLVATPASALAAAETKARELGYEPHLVGAELEGEARDLAAGHAQLVQAHLESGGRTAILSGGEATVTVRGKGRGGPNQEFALALALALEGLPGVHALAADTDGSDGGSGAADDPAGAFVAPDTLERAARAGLDPRAALEDNDSTRLFDALADLLITGPTWTNVNDLRAIVVDSAGSADQFAARGAEPASSR